MKVLLHYRKTCSYDVNKEQIDEIVDEDELFYYYNEEQIKLVKAKDAKNKKIFRWIDINKEKDLDTELVKIGYAFSYPLDPVKGRNIKIPKKDVEVRELFNFYDAKKASFWTHDYDTIDLAKINTMKEKYSFLRGLISARGGIKKGNDGLIFISIRDIYVDFEDFLWKLFYGIDCNIVPESNAIYFASREQIFNFITNISFIQKKKEDLAINCYRQKIRKVNDVIPLDDPYYMFYHIINFCSEKDYSDDLATTYDLFNKKSGKDIMYYAIERTKHKQLYPIIWLYNHGLKFSKKNEELFIENLKRSYGGYVNIKEEDLKKIVPLLTHPNKDGQGILYNQDGQKKYEGEFLCCLRHGQGIEYINGIKNYKGQWKMDEIYGRGIYYYSDGQKYFEGTKVYDEERLREFKDWEKNKIYDGIIYYDDGQKMYEGLTHNYFNTIAKVKGIYYSKHNFYIEGRWSRYNLIGKINNKIDVNIKYNNIRDLDEKILEILKQN